MGVHTAIKNICRKYEIDLIDRGYGDNTNVIVAIGSGMLMAAMDMLPGYRYAFEFRKNIQPDAFSLLNIYCQKITIIAWFSISKPLFLMKCLACLDEHKISYYSNEQLTGKRYVSLKELQNYENISHPESDLV